MRGKRRWQIKKTSRDVDNNGKDVRVLGQFNKFGTLVDFLCPVMR